MSLIQKNTRKQGDVGLGKAIAYFTSMGYSVALPLTESQRYDIIVDDGDRLYRVEVKSTRHKRSGSQFYTARLATSGGNRSWAGEIKTLSTKDCDYVFIYVENGDEYLVPVELVEGKANLTLTNRLDEYKL